MKAAALIGLVAVAALGVLTFAYLTEVGADVFLAIIEVVTPPRG